MTRAPDPVGTKEIAERFGMSVRTLEQILYRSRQGKIPVPFPEPRWTVSGRPAWDFNRDIAPWMRAREKWKADRYAL